MADWLTPSRMSTGAWVLFSAAIIATIAGLMGAGISNAAVAAIALPTAVLATRIWWGKRHTHSRAWWGFVAALDIAATADVAAALLELAGGRLVREVLVVAHLGSYALTVVVIFILARRRVGEGRAAVTLDAMTFSTAVTLLLAAAMLHDNRVAVPTALTAAAAPWIILALSSCLAVGLGMLWFSDGNRNPWGKYVSIGTGWITFSAFYSLLTSGGQLSPGGMHAGLLMYGTSLMAINALGDSEPPVSAGYSAHPARPFALVACLISPWLLVLAGVSVPWLIIGFGALILNGLVLTRLALLVQVVHERNGRLQHLAVRDPLTQVYNRGHLEELMYEAQAHEGTVWLGLIDLDYFKRFNDMFGHQEGDSVLYESAQNWSTQLGDRGVVARYGGEEFAVLLHDEDEDGAAHMAERLRTAVPEGLTCSVGLARWNNGEGQYDVMRRADLALYSVKANGRDGVLLDLDGKIEGAVRAEHHGAGAHAQPDAGSNRAT